MFIEVYNVQKKETSVRKFVLTLVLTVLKFTRVINGYSKYGKVSIINESGNVTTYNILLEEVM